MMGLCEAGRGGINVRWISQMIQLYVYPRSMPMSTLMNCLLFTIQGDHYPRMGHMKLK